MMIETRSKLLDYDGRGTSIPLMNMKMTLSGVLAAMVASIPVGAANLIVNPDAEAGPGSPNGSVVLVPGWTVTGNFTAVQYGAIGGFPLPTDPGPPVRGANFFAGEYAHISSGSQTIDISPWAGTIDSGAAGFDLSGWFGGWLDQRDYATLTVTFRDGVGGFLGNFAVGGVSAADRGGITGLFYRSGSGMVPVGSRSADMLLEMVQMDGSYNDGYADNLSFEISAVPEPAAYALFGALGLAAYAGVRRTRRA